MPALNFPSSPTNGQVYTANGVTFTYNSSVGAWEGTISIGTASVTASETPPVSPSAGNLWFSTDEGSLYVYYDGYWVEPSSGGGIGPSFVASDTAPSSPSVGQGWLDTSNGIFYVYYDGYWIEPSSGGSTGPANSLSIGTVSTGEPAATITGTAPNQVLNLTLPSGGSGDVSPLFLAGV